MNTTYRVTTTTGTTTVDSLAEVKALVQADPTASVKAVVTYEPCPQHKGYEATNCPVCGTAATI